MNVRAVLEKKIETQEREIDNLRAQILKKEAFLEGLREALKVIPREDNDQLAAQTLRAGSDMAKARDFLQSMGEPKYIDDILRGIGKEVNKKNKASFAGSIGAYARNGEIFIKTAPNTFGLVEHRTKTRPPDEPPEDFGVDDTPGNINGKKNDDEIPF